MTGVPDDLIGPDVRDAAGLVPSVTVLGSLLTATIGSPTAAPALLDLLDALVDQAVDAPPLIVDEDAGPERMILVYDSLISIVGPELSADVIDSDGVRSATVISGDLICSSVRGPGVEVVSAPPSAESGSPERADDTGAELVGATVQILRSGVTVVDVAIDDRGRVIDHLDVDGLTAAWADHYQREMADTLQPDEAGLGDPQESDAELLAATERISERAERRRQEAADAETADRLAAPDPVWVATHTVPDGVMSVWPAPDPSLPRDPAGPLASGTEVRVEQRRGDWAEISTSEGRTGWVDARRLIELLHPPT